MKTSCIIFLWSLTLLFLVACEVETQTEVEVETSSSSAATSPDDLLTEEREVSSFTRVRLETMGDLTLVQGEAERLVLELSPKYEGAIETEVRGRTLVISDNRNTMTKLGRDVLRFEVTLPQLEAVEVPGSGDVSAANVELGVLELDVSGSGDVSVTGSAATVAVNVSGSGDVDASGLRADGADVRVSGSGDVEVCAVEGLEIDVSGSGDVTYYGEPSSPETSVSGSGEVEAGGACP